MSRHKVKNMDRDQQKALFWKLSHPQPVTKRNIQN